MSDHVARNGNVNVNILQRLEEILADIKTLVDYLGRLDNGRLQAHFDDTRSAVTEAVQFRAVPPCRTYAGFLARLAWLGTSIRKGEWPAKPMSQRPAAPQAPAAAPANAAAAPPGVGEPLEDIPFLIWSRDFLAAVAAPATVESIEVTRAYVETRTRHGRLHRTWQWLRHRTADHAGAEQRSDGHGAATHVTLVPRARQGEQAGRTLCGERLAMSVKRLEAIALAITLLVLLVSTYALSGQSILDQKQSEAADYAALNHAIQTIAETMPAAARSIERNPLASVTCATMQPQSAQTTVADLVPFAAAAGLQQAADVTGPDDPNRSTVRLAFYLCQQQHARVMLHATAASLKSWVLLVPKLSILFGDVSATSPDSDAKDLLEQSGGIAKPILSAVTLYLMPCLYGLIGAAAATLRMLRRKVDASTLTYTDRGRVRQDVILGVMCGATIGLFASYILGASPTQGLGLSALALLAGYNVSGVFAFLDELSARLFRPTDTVPGKA